MCQLLNIQCTRKSCRSYQDKHVDKAIIEDIVAAGLNAPSGMNKQTPRFVVVTDDAVVAKLSKMNADILGMPNDPFYGAKDLIIVLAKKPANKSQVLFGRFLNYFINLFLCMPKRLALYSSLCKLMASMFY